MCKSLAPCVVAVALTLGGAALAQAPGCAPETALRLEARGASMPFACAERSGDAWPDWTYVFPEGEARLEAALAALNRALAAAGRPAASLADATVREPEVRSTRRAEGPAAAPHM